MVMIQGSGLTDGSRGRRIWRFGPHLLDEGERRLTADGRPVSLSPRAFELLVLLVERHGRLVERRELMELLWPDTFVEAGTLDRHVSNLRKALGSAAELLETVPKAGYRFTAPAEELSEGEPTATGLEPRDPERRRSRRRIVGAVAVTAVAAAGVLGLATAWRVTAPTASPPRPPASVAVLPFTPLGDAGIAEQLELGIADVLITTLSQLPELEVRPLGAVAGFAGTTFDPLAVGRSLGVEGVLEGTLRHRDGRLRISARLLSVADGRSLWSGSFDHADRDLLAVERAIGREAGLALLPALRVDREAGLADAGEPLDSEAHDLYLRGRYFWAKRTSAGNHRAVELFDAALQLAPDYAEAEAGLAAAYALLAGLAEPPEVYEEARRHAQRALLLDARSADAHAVLGLVAENYDGDWARAEDEYRQALALQPHHPTTHHWYGEMLALLGRFDEGISFLEQAARSDPLSLAIATDVAKAYYFARRWDDAVAGGEAVLTMDPSYAWAWGWVGAAELERGEVERSLECLDRFAELEGSPFAAALRIWALMAAGRGAEAEVAHMAIEAQAREGYAMPVALAMARLARGDEDGAIDALEIVMATRQNRVGISTSPVFARLRDQPRFRDLLRKAGLSLPPGPEGPGYQGQAR